MQQTTSFIGLSVPVSGAAAGAPRAGVPATPAGLFQQLLAGAMQGTAPVLIPPAASPGMQTQHGESTRAAPLTIPVDPPVPTLMAHPSAEHQAQVMKMAGEPIPFLSLTGLVLRPSQPAEVQAPPASARPLSTSDGPLTADPVPATGTAEAEIPVLPTEAPAQTLPGPMHLTMVAVMAQTLSAPPAPAQSNQSQPASPQPSAPPMALTVDLSCQQPVPADPLVEQFVQKAVATAAGEGAAPDASPAVASSEPPAPTFADLVDMVQKLDQPAGKESIKGEPKLDLKPEHPVAELAQSFPEQPQVVAEGRPQPLLTESAHPARETPEAQRQPVDPESVVRQVARSVKVMLDGKRSEVQLQLNPEHLGKVAVRLILNEGSVQANITARDASVRAALESGLEQLKVRFQEQGLKVEHVNVSVGSDGGFTQSHQSGQDQPRQQNQQGQPAGRQLPWRVRQEIQQHPDEPQNRTASPRMWGYGRTGARINSLA